MSSAESGALHRRFGLGWRRLTAGLVLLVLGAWGPVSSLIWMTEAWLLRHDGVYRVDVALALGADRRWLGGGLLVVAVWVLRSATGVASSLRRWLAAACLAASAVALWHSASLFWEYFITGGLDGFTLVFVGLGVLDILRGASLMGGAWLLSPIWSRGRINIAPNAR